MSLQLGPESEPRALDWEGSEPTTSLMSVVKCGVFPQLPVFPPEEKIALTFKCLRASLEYCMAQSTGCCRDPGSWDWSVRQAEILCVVSEDGGRAFSHGPRVSPRVCSF